jgi:hypothetical protein
VRLKEPGRWLLCPGEPPVVGLLDCGL